METGISEGWREGKGSLGIPEVPGRWKEAVEEERGEFKGRQ